MFNIFLINDDLNPFTIITNLKSRLIVNKADMSKLKDIVDKNKIITRIEKNSKKNIAKEIVKWIKI